MSMVVPNRGKRRCPARAMLNETRAWVIGSIIYQGYNRQKRPKKAAAQSSRRGSFKHF
jgi:hypothetical protein